MVMAADVLLEAPPAAEVPKARRSYARWISRLAQLGVVTLALVVMAMALLPLALGYQGQVVLSGSMRPHFAVGDINYIKKIPVSQISVGTVITFHVPESQKVLITHRVIAISGVGASLAFTTKGDANPAPDGAPVPAQAVVGEEVFRVPKLGRAALWMRNPGHYRYVAGGLFLLVVLYEGRTVLSEARARRSRRKASRAATPEDAEQLATAGKHARRRRT